MSGALAPALLVALERRVGRRRRSVLVVAVAFRRRRFPFFLFLFFFFILVTNLADILSDDVLPDRHFAVVVAVVVVDVDVVVAVDRVDVVVDVVPRLRWMDEFPVTSQRLRVDESLAAVLARVGPLAGVAETVTLKAGRVFVGLAAVGAVVRPENNDTFQNMKLGKGRAILNGRQHGQTLVKKDKTLFSSLKLAACVSHTFAAMKQNCLT